MNLLARHARMRLNAGDICVASAGPGRLPDAVAVRTQKHVPDKEVSPRFSSNDVLSFEEIAICPGFPFFLYTRIMFRCCLAINT